MRTAPNEPNLLDDVLRESAPAVDSLAPLLRAVRARRRRRHAAPILAALLLAGLAWNWTNAIRRERSPGELTGEWVSNVPVAVEPPALFTSVTTRSLAAVERVITDDAAVPMARVSTQADPDLRASDRELFALAGNRGLGLFRLADRTEFLIAQTH